MATRLSLRAAAGLSTAVGLVFMAAPALAQSLPSGGSFAAGSGGIASSGNMLTVTQSSGRGVVDWNSFAIGAGNVVLINNGSGATLNRVTGSASSTIAGALIGTGSVFLINPNGVVVTTTGAVVTGGNFVASTRDTSDAAFLSGGPLTFAGASAGTVANLGQIVSSNGDVVLVGASVTNSGTISAANGTAGLVAANKLVLTDAAGPSGLTVAPDLTSTGSVTNTGTVKAAAAALSAAGGNIYTLAGNTAGLIQATGTSSIDGQVWLSAPGGTTNVAGTITASNPGGAGGKVETSGGTVNIGSATVTAGTGGSWLIDPTNLTINSAAASSIASSLSSGTGVTELTNATSASGFGSQSAGAGDINVTSNIIWTGSAVLTLSAFNNVNLSALILVGANGGLVITTGNNVGGTSAAGTNFNVTTGGQVGFTSSATPSLTINGASYTLLSSVAQVEGIGLASTGHYALITNLTFPSSVNPIGANGKTPNLFQGTFNGLGNTISGLTISDPNDPNVGLFAALGANANISNLNFTNASITTGYVGQAGALAGINYLGTVTNVSTTNSTIGWGNSAGAIVGVNYGTISNASATNDTLIGYARVGGLVGYNAGTVQNSTVGNSTVTGYDSTGNLTDSVNGASTYKAAIQAASTNGTIITYAGGIVGYNIGATGVNTSGVISGVTATGVTVSNGNVAGGIAGYNDGNGKITSAKVAGGTVSTDAFFNPGNPFSTSVGGAVGNNIGTISYTDSTAAVSGPGFAGGLVGFNQGNVSQAYATGNVTGTGSAAGGLAGGSFGSFTNVYATGTVTGKGVSGGLIGSLGGGTLVNAYADNASVQGDQAAGAIVGLYTPMAGTSFTNVYYYSGVTINNAASNAPSKNGGIAALPNNNYISAPISGVAATGVTGITTGTTAGFTSTYWSGGSASTFPTLLNTP